jgi:predicted oxidoreductase
MGSAGALGAELNLASGSLKLIGARRGGGAPPPRGFLQKGPDVVVERDLMRFVDRRRALTGENLLSARGYRR